MTEAAAALDIPINPFTHEHPICVDDAPAPITFDNLRLQVVGPTAENLEKLRQEWLAWLKAQEKGVQERDLAECSAHVLPDEQLGKGAAQQPVQLARKAFERPYILEHSDDDGIALHFSDILKNDVYPHPADPST